MSLLLASAAGLAPAHAEEGSGTPLVVAQANVDPAVEKEAFDAAKELGTVEAWQAFLNTFATGFRADLARAYIAKLGTATTTPATVIPPVQTATPPVQDTAPPVATRLGLIDLGPGVAPWQNGTLDLDDGNRAAYVAQVAGNGMELVAYCVPPQTKKGTAGLALMLRENPRGIYPFFDERLHQGIDGSPAAGPDFRQIALRFDDGSVFGVTGRVFGMTGELEITVDGKPAPATGKIVDAMMGGHTMTVLADPFSGTFQLTNSRPALCSVLAACGAKLSACKGISAPKISSKPVTTQPKLVVPRTVQGTVPPPPGFVPSQRGFVPAPKPFVPLAGSGRPQGGGATLVIQQTATGPCPDPKTQVRNAAGQCVCNYMTTLVNGTCVKACVGATRDQNGNCQCPPGQSLNGGIRCIDFTDKASFDKTVKAAESQTCPDGRLRDVSGACLSFCSGERIWNGQKCIAPIEMKNYYCRDLGVSEEEVPEGACKAAPGGGLTVKLVPQGGTGKTKETGGTTGIVLPQGAGGAAPVLQLLQGIGVLGGQGGGQTQQQKTVTCTGGQVAQANGTCACPSGQQLNAGKCAVVKVIKQQTIVITCTGGQVPTNGKCACPSGQQLSGGKCVAPGGLQGIIPGAPGGLNLLLSDRRMKTDVSEVATLPDGIRLYAFRYLSDETMRVGVMAQDLLADARTRAAVHAVDGLYRVDYAALGLRMATFAEWRERGIEAVLRQR